VRGLWLSGVSHLVGEEGDGHGDDDGQADFPVVQPIPLHYMIRYKRYAIFTAACRTSLARKGTAMAMPMGRLTFQSFSPYRSTGPSITTSAGFSLSSLRRLGPAPTATGPRQRNTCRPRHANATQRGGDTGQQSIRRWLFKSTKTDRCLASIVPHSELADLRALNRATSE
jgi:hypothetical protein